MKIRTLEFETMQALLRTLTAIGIAVLLVAHARAGEGNGAFLFHDIAPGDASSNPEGFVLAGDKLFFRASADAVPALWVNDGSESGTRAIGPMPLYPEVSRSTGIATAIGVPFGGRLFFSASEPVLLSRWRSDGTSSGTAPIWEQQTTNMTAGGGSLYFFCDGELVRVGSANAEPVALFALPALPFGNFFDGIVPFAGGLFLSEVWLSTGATGNGLWWTENPAEAPHRLVTFATERLRGTWVPREPIALGDRIFFVGSDTPHGEELWQSDATEAGTRLVADINPTVEDDEGIGSAPRNLTILGAQLLFLADDGEHGVELWRSGGSQANTAMVRDIRPGAEGIGRDFPTQGFRYSGSMVATSRAAFFVADDGEHGAELWMSDGTMSGTHLVRDIYQGPESSFPSSLRVIDGVVVFTACNENGCEPWATSGDETVQLADIGGPFSSNPRGYTARGDLIFFAAEDERGRELWALPRAALPQPVRSPCARACDGNGPPRIADLVHAVAVALGRDVSPCPGIDLDANGAISIAEIVRGVREALEPSADCAA